MSAPGSRGFRHVWPLIPAALLLLGSTAAGVSAIVARTGGRFIYALDDAYIHMAMAANLARFGVWGCTPFRFSSASSSPLWTALLGVVYALTGVHEITPLLLNLACGLATLAVSDYWLRRSHAGAWTRVATLVVLVLAIPMPSMVLFGMEHLLHVLLSVAFAGAAAWALAEPLVDPAALRRQTARLATLAALLAASRYEGLFLVGLACAAMLVRGQWRRGVTIGLAALAPIVVLGLVSMGNGSLFLPNSLMLKAGGEAASFWTLLFKPLQPDLLVLEANRELAWLVAGGLLAALAGAVAARGVWRTWVLLPLALMLMVLLHVHYALSSTFWVYRYDAYLVGVGVVVGAVVVTALRAHLAPHGSWGTDVAAAAVVVVWAALLTPLSTGARPTPEIESAAQTYREHFRAADFVRTMMPGETILANDLGVMAFFSNARVLDTFGLCDIEPVRLRREGRYNAADLDSWTLPYEPTAAVVQLSWGWAAERVPADWRKVAEVELAPERRVLGIFATRRDGRDAGFLRAAVDSYYRPLAPQGYHVRLF